MDSIRLRNCKNKRHIQDTITGAMWVGEEEKGGLCDSMDGDVLCVVAEA